MRLHPLITIVTCCGLVAVAAAQPASSVWGSAGMAGIWSPVADLAVYDDGTGPALYLGGRNMWWAGSTSYSAHGVVRWRNGAYEALGDGLYSNSPGNFEIKTLQPFDDGSGTDLFVSGKFSHADWIPTGPIARFGPRSPTIQLSQPAGPGTGVLITNDEFMPGREYYNLFSLEPCPGGPGTGPYVGLCASNVQTLLDQFALPVGAAPFHFLGTARTMTHGPWLLPAGITIDSVCFDWTNSQPVAISPVDRYTIL